MHKKPPVPIIVIIVIAIIIGGYYGIKALTANGYDQLKVSGTIETTEIIISPEIPGKVVEVYVDEGASVSQDDPLFRLDDSLLQAQRFAAESSLKTAMASVESAQAARDTAQINYELAFNAVRAEAASNRTSDWAASNLSGYSLPGGYFSRQELIDASMAEVDAARIDRDDARIALNDLLAESASLEFIKAEKELLASRFAEQPALDALNRAKVSSEQDLIDAAQSIYDKKQSETETAQAAYDDIADSQVALDIISFRLELTISQERYESAQDRLIQLQIGEDSPKLKAAQSVLNQAELAVAQANAMVSQAQAQLKLLDVQIGKLMVLAPTDGTILTRRIQPGEMVSAAASAFTLGKLDELTIVVYVPEDVYGILALGQMADLSVDSYPGEVFQAKISRIADQAEFTPRNVQTVEGRKATVFAIHLQVVDPGGKLKPGMAADVTFGK